MVERTFLQKGVVSTHEKSIGKLFVHGFVHSCRLEKLPKQWYNDSVVELRQQFFVSAVGAFEKEIPMLRMPEPPVTDTEPICDTEEGKASIDTTETFTPYKGKIRKPGTGCVTMINDHLYEGRFTPRVNGKRVSKNVYAKTREECEEKLAELIKAMKEDIKAGKIA